MNYALRFCLILLSTIPLFSPAQATNLDSLENALSDTKGEERLVILNQLTLEISRLDAAKGLLFGEEGLLLAKEVGNDSLLSEAANNLSIACFFLGRFEEMIAYNELALPIRAARGDSMGVLSSSSKIGNAHFKLGNQEQALNAFVRALKIARKEQHTAYEGRLLNDIGSVYEVYKDYETALGYRREALALSEKQGDVSGIRSSKGNIATVLQKQGKIKAAREMLMEVMEEAEAEEASHFLANLYQNIGANFRLEKNHEKGAEYYEKSLKTYKAIGDQFGEAELLVNLGKTYTDLKAYEKGREALQKGLALGREIGSNANLENVYGGLAALEREQSNFEKALGYQMESARYKDSVFTESGNRLLADMRVKYETEKKEKELAQTQLQVEKDKVKLQQKEIEIERSNQRLLLALAGMILLGLVAGLVYQIQTARRKRLQSEYELRQRAERAEHAQELAGEKLRISRELHDNIGSQITLLISSLDNMSYREERPKPKEKLEQMAYFGRETVKDLRNTIWAMKLEAADLGALIQKLRDLIQHNDSRLQVRIQSDAPDDFPLNAVQLLNLYRISQEVIQNAIKYSQAEWLNMRIDNNDKTLLVNYADNGKGFRLSEVGAGNGLRNMSSRAKSLGALIDIYSEPGSGTNISLRLNLEKRFQ